MFTPYQNIAAIGVELEGGWSDPPCDCHDIGHDGSVQVDARYQGEIPIGPLASWREAEDSIRTHYPDVVNRSCGLHVHLSFPTLGHYSAIMSPRFEAFLHSRLMRYGRIKHFSRSGQFFQRLAGRNHYCGYRFNEGRVTIQSTSIHKPEERYAFLNYCHRLHGTVEVRALPAFTRPMAAVNAIKYVVESFNRFLSLPNALVPHVETETSTTNQEDLSQDIDATLDPSAVIADLFCEVA